MKIVFRTDANKHIGAGHVMRCLSIADAFFASGHQITFILADDEAKSLINGRGYEAFVLHSDYNNMEGELRYWPDITMSLVVIDSYFVTANYFSILYKLIRETGGKLVYIDDIYSFPYTVDVLVNYNAYATRGIYNALYKGMRGKKPLFILGPQYAPLRSMFRGVQKKQQSQNVRNVLISTGGSDEIHLSLSIINHILNDMTMSKTDNTEVKYHIILGVMNADKERIRRLARNNIILHENVVDMRGLISLCDIAVTAAGSTMYEICACGVPMITYVVADNQICGAQEFEKLGLGVNVGDIRDPETIDTRIVMSGKLNKSAVNLIFKALTELSDNFEKRVSISRKMQQMIDGYGADRLVKELVV